MDDTIAAISTPIGPGGIAIIRLSGPQALGVADALFRSPQGEPSRFGSHTIHLGEIVAGSQILDQVLLTVMRAPRSYTCEDVVEIHCHGGPQIARSILQQTLTHGARLAAPGEFTQRAFLNGRLDLTQAEAVLDLIQARTERAQNAATRALEGHLSRRLQLLQERLVDALAQLEAHIDFPEEDISPASLAQLRAELAKVEAGITELLATSREGELLREGLSVVILGRPNVGKSSLLNALLGRERAIVSPVPGTTRDVIEESLSIRGLPVRLADTAGVRQTRGRVEAIGVANTRKQLATSDICIHILDGSRPFARVDMDLASTCAERPSIHVVHKADLPQRLRFPAGFPARILVSTSAVTGQGLEQLREAIERVALADGAEQHHHDIAINARQADVLTRAREHLRAATTKLGASQPPELIAQEARLALNAIGEVLGKTTPDEILNAIFSRFCIGK